MVFDAAVRASGRIHCRYLLGRTERHQHCTVCMGEISFQTAHFGTTGRLKVSAIHNPVDYNELKLIREGARPISINTELSIICENVASG